MRCSVLFVAVLALLAIAPAPAHAQGYFVPNIGYDFGGDAGNCPSLSDFVSGCSEKRTSYGVTAGFLAGGIFGFEEDFTYAPDFFGQSASFGDNSVLTLMSNVVLAIPAGPVRPYASGGVGLLRSKVSFNTASLLSFSNSSFGWDIGGGVMILLPAHLGVRGDFRHFHSFSDVDILGITVGNTKLNFSRVSVGLVLH